MVDGKIYVGFTTNFTKRKNKHFNELRNNKHKNEHLQNAVNKYGIENFVFEILEECLDEGFILSSMEHWWCNMLNTHNKEFGYNVKPTNPYNKSNISQETKDKIGKANKGRIYSKGRKHSQETIEKIRKRKAERPIYRGWKWSEEAKKKLSKKNKGGKGWTGRKHTEESKKKMSEIRKGIKFSKTHIENIGKANVEKNKKFRVPIVGFDKNLNIIGEWDSLILAAKELNLKSELISQVLNKRITHHKGYTFIYKKDFKEGKLPKVPIFQRNKRKVLQLEDDNIINIFNSVREAAKYIEVSETHLGKCCKEGKKFKNYIWKYKEN